MRARLKGLWVRLIAFRERHWVPAFYWFGTNGGRVILNVVGRWKVYGRENVPAEGPLLIVSNHLHNADPPLIGAAVLRRRIRYMAKIELFSSRFSFIVRWWGAFPVRRFEADLAAMLNAERILKRGEVLGMFPEGTRSRTGVMGEPHPGTALIALRAGAPILPCAITGTEGLSRWQTYFTKPRITVRIGRPIPVEQVRRPTDQQVSLLTRQLADAIRALLPPEYAAPYTQLEGAASTNGDHPSGE